ncbi:hypothetical protein CPB84DRAFT_367429 [Gymnopilus junonius]|uniref:Uncharacterized protein n=1 Tax=Gymnopilus junonius TaxID=109634 RepID=A0A9P5NU76_GYMJU|nr:hypothetical protein CPB84DRAFT_367429 [Gymnopilus junonius]
MNKTKEPNPDLRASVSKGGFFFALHLPENELFDLIFDHTFFCVRSSRSWKSRFYQDGIFEG